MTRFGYASKDYPGKEYPREITQQVKYLSLSKCEYIYIEDYGFEKTRELNELLANLKEKDTLIVHDLQVLGKKKAQLDRLLFELNKKRIQLMSQFKTFDMADDGHFYNVTHQLYDVAKTCERESIKKKLLITQNNGTILGRPKVDIEVRKKIQTLYNTGKWTMREIALFCDVSLGTVFKYVQMPPEEIEI